ncbi:MAG TPA: hypothetical protein VKU00_33580 [Chthonomonadaceae bacterium]|nr:hypothetical protein [Chthonomonadaceae bacterium]
MGDGVGGGAKPEPLFIAWSQAYGKWARDRSQPDRLLDLGTRMRTDLPQVAEFLHTLIEEEALTPLRVVFAIERIAELTHSRDGYARLGQQGMAQEAQALLNQIMG